MAGEQDMLPGGLVLIYLPPNGANRRNPDFWGDRDVRRMVVALHRQMMIDQARAQISDAFGEARTPSKSALQRAWARLDRAVTEPRLRAVARSSGR